MRILRYEADGETKYGVLEPDDSIRQLTGSPFGRFEIGRPVASLSDVRVLAPVEQPSKIIGVGLNYVSHIEEIGAATPEFPVLFVKPTTAIIGQGDAIVYPRQGRRSSTRPSLRLSLARAQGTSLKHALWSTYWATPVATTSASALFSSPR